MSFSSDVRLELAHTHAEHDHCMRAEIAGMLLSSGNLLLTGGGGVALSLSSELAAIARHIYLLIRDSFGARCEIVVTRRSYPKVRNVYALTLRGEDAVRVLVECGAVHKSCVFALRGGLPERLLGRECCRRAFMRGAFLGCGSVADPASKYHLEFAAGRESFARAFAEFLQKCELNAKTVNRKNVFVVYLKESEQIISLLGMMGAHEALLRMESARVVKAVRNRANRAANCDNANMDKAINASIRQVENIEWLEENLGLSHLTPALEQVARARLENHNATLEELGSMIEPPLGKSAVNHRLRRIEELAAKLRQKQGGGEETGDAE